jgi:hypothetical protein
MRIVRCSRITLALPGEIGRWSLTTLREKDGPTYRPSLHVAGEAAAVHTRAGRLDPARPGVVSRLRLIGWNSLSGSQRAA